MTHHATEDLAILRALPQMTVVAPGDPVETVAATKAVAVADMLARDGIHARVLSMHTIKPLDVAAVLAAARDTGAIATLEEHSIIGGLGSAVAEVLCEAGLPAVRCQRLALPSAFGKAVGDQDYLRKVHGLDADSVAGRLRVWLADCRQQQRPNG